MTLNRRDVVAIARGFALRYIAAALSLVVVKILILLIFGRGVWIADKADLALFALILAFGASFVSWYLKRREIS